MRFGKGAVVVLAAAVAMMAAQAAWADESGTYQWLRSFHYDYLTVDHGEQTFVGGFLTGTGTILESSGGPFVVGASTSAKCLVFTTNADGDLTLEAPCVDTDTSGDIQYTRAVRKQGDVGMSGAGGDGVWELLGGTGKYAGVTGICSYWTEYIDDGVGVALIDCAWSTE